MQLDEQVLQEEDASPRLKGEALARFNAEKASFIELLCSSPHLSPHPLAPSAFVRCPPLRSAMSPRSVLSRVTQLLASHTLIVLCEITGGVAVPLWSGRKQ